jgi:hypothetical protein
MLFDLGPTETVTLARGFVDPETKKTFKGPVVIRQPTVEDEIRRDILITELAGSTPAMGRSRTVDIMALVLQCIVSWEGLPQPRFEHLRMLTSKDADALVSALNRVQEERVEGNGEEGNDEESSSPPSQP